MDRTGSFVKKGRWLRFLGWALAACLLCAAFAGCSTQSDTQDSQAQAEQTEQLPQSEDTDQSEPSVEVPEVVVVRYPTVEELLTDEEICEQYRSVAEMIWGTGGLDTEINIYAADNRVVISYVIQYESSEINLASMRSNAIGAMSMYILPCNTISDGIEQVVETPNAGLRVEIVTLDGVVLYDGDYANNTSTEDADAAADGEDADGSGADESAADADTADGTGTESADDAETGEDTADGADSADAGDAAADGAGDAGGENAGPDTAA